MANRLVRSPNVSCFGIYVREAASIGVIRAFWFPVLAWALSFKHGVWWLGTGRLRVMLKASWNEPLFSERYGNARHIPLGGGWRVRFFRSRS